MALCVRLQCLLASERSRLASCMQAAEREAAAAMFTALARCIERSTALLMAHGALKIQSAARAAAWPFFTTICARTRLSKTTKQKLSQLERRSPRLSARERQQQARFKIADNQRSEAQSLAPAPIESDRLSSTAIHLNELAFRPKKRLPTKQEETMQQK